MSYEIELGPGERLALPEELIASIPPGTWILSLRPKDAAGDETERDRSAFLSGYAPEDEGLYDDAPAG